MTIWLLRRLAVGLGLPDRGAGREHPRRLHADPDQDAPGERLAQRGLRVVRVRGRRFLYQYL